MAKLDLKISRILQGDFEPVTDNLMLVFQVNCPGCFTHALPIAQTIHSAADAPRLKVMGLSTAFEDFDLNTSENTELLLHEGRLVGETARVLNRTEIEPAMRPSFPIAFDQLEDFSTVTKDSERFQRICQNSPYYHQLQDAAGDEWASQVLLHLRSSSASGSTFTSHLMRGTPTWILFDLEYNIRWHAFGHITEEEIWQRVRRQ